MPGSLQQFLTGATQKAAADLETAIMRLPEDKRNWSPAEKARSAVDQVAECAMMNGMVAKLMATRVWPADYDFAGFQREKEELMRDWSAVKSLLDMNTDTMVAAISALPEEDVTIAVQMPWGPMTLAQIAAYPYWNMAYHEGQINYIASILGCLT